MADRVVDRIRFAIAQPTEWQRLGNQIDAAMARTAYCSGEDKSQKGTLSYQAIIRPCAIVED
ncbi:MAG: hypothetical protein DME98_08215 [Verrucomicrobia bacterium]|nr:MAG: hypothetical protein DME98_08215 [Verrucomicrobiota bacterium]PYJ35963.1 MAG: hypothetical protein DME88_00240 [Verrucomicrobiota bacterium]